MHLECSVSGGQSEEGVSIVNIFRSSRTLLLHFSNPWGPITPFQVWRTVPTLALISPRRIGHFHYGVI